MSSLPPVTIALFTDSLEPSGVGEVLSLLSCFLPADRYRQILICPEAAQVNPLVERCSGVSAVRRLTVREDGHADQFAELVALLHQEGVQIFHNHIGATWEGDWGTLAARMAGVPVVLTTEHLPCLIERPGQRWFKRRVNRLADRVIAVSESVRQTLVQAEIAAPEQAVTIRNGIELSRFVELRLPEPARHMAAETRGPWIGTIGRMTEQKGHFYLLQAVPKVIARHPEARFLWLGDGPERPRLEAEARRLGVTDHVWFLGRQPEAWRWLPLFAFTALPSLFEGLPLVALESMAAGRAIIGTRVCGTTDAVLEGETGLLVPPRDPGALAESILWLLDRPQDQARMGERARRRAEAEFSVERMVREHDSLYTSLLARQTALKGLQTAARSRVRVNGRRAGVDAAPRAPVGWSGRDQPSGVPVPLPEQSRKSPGSPAPGST
jgi:glycosyltransferase involved in cell wall biosynthesis